MTTLLFARGVDESARLMENDIHFLRVSRLKLNSTPSTSPTLGLIPTKCTNDEVVLG